MDSWDEIKTAYHVARLGTVSGAAEALGVHHATVIRHIDAIENRLGAKLFQRHARGYTPTEAGRDLLGVAQTTDDQFTQLVGRIRGRGDSVTGELIVTTISALAPLLVPSLAKFQDLHPELIVRLLTDERVFRLEYGEAHVAVRAGPKPEEPDNVVQFFQQQHGTMYASPDYLEEYGTPQGLHDLREHRFVSHDSETARAPFDRWIRENIPHENITFRGTEQQVLQQAVCAGAGIGYFTHWDAKRHPDLVAVTESLEEWSSPIWLVTHVDLHRTMKVQAFTSFLKEEAENWFQE
ncbi:Transcriptional regulator, LysR family [Candidatus Rhodobacter oscarellae]|uniref:Transcriptional regulator, LysR family n=1 Tax=Candidatus Rhodobacter oscarellae TaxID=1675527 RepID=A0A0J9ECQ9_9RHOB|nr:LysR family transcriptional regulator [Candidatus Rhodobacter lobularis]KMW60515.1 Transcriptional regulator, LysR family [Candidatus Rhodobacter lobularis]